MNCGRSSSVEWKLPKLQRRVRFPSPAPPPRPAARRAVLLCPLRAYNGDWRRHQHPREPRAHTNGCGTVQRGIARHKGPTRGRHSAQGLRGVPPPLPAWRAPRRLQNLGAVPVGLKYLAQHGPNTGTSTKKTRPAQSKRAHFGTKFAQQEPGDLIFDTKFAQLARNAAFSIILRVQGEFCLVVDDSKPSRANFFSQTY